MTGRVNVAAKQPTEFRLAKYVLSIYAKGLGVTAFDVDLDRLAKDLQDANDRGEGVNLYAEHGMFPHTPRYRGEGGHLILTNHSLSGPWKLMGFRMFFATAREALLLLLNLHEMDGGQSKPNHGFLVVKVEEFQDPSNTKEGA